MINRKPAAPTPPMGWNSWDCYGAAVDEAALLGNAAYIAAHLKDYGWEYVVCDIQWYEPTAIDTCYNNFAPLCMDAYARLIPAENRFPSAAGGKGFAVIAEKIHAMGLKFGIHIMRGIPRQAVHSGAVTKSGVPARQLALQYSLCPWNTDMYGVDHRQPGAQEYYDSLFELYAAWGVDFVKVDDICNTEYNRENPYAAEKEIEMIRKAIDGCGREMVLSLSPGPADIRHAWHLAAHADMWRLTGDFWDERQKLIDMFRRCELWYAHVGDGHWPDCDMLPLGRLCVSDRNTHGRQCRLTEDEQITMMNLWCIFRSPLILGAELRENDAFTLSLLINRDVLAVNQTSSKNRPVISTDKEAVWQCEMPDGAAVVALFNLTETKRTVSVTLRELGLDGKYTLFDLWKQKAIGEAETAISAELNPTASVMYRLIAR
ncbi:MAG: glycoside hydrolase family 27 protein [Clostridia bacterium]|nr:glycoside hydrolase family 27 protein [Clostridia bacterium]